MSRLAIPLGYRTLWTTGDILLWAELTLSIKTARGSREEVVFRVDSATEMTTMPAAVARQLDLPIPQTTVPGLRMKGQEVRAGVIRVQVVGMDATEYVFPCYFLGDPSLLRATQPRSLLGLAGVVDKIRIGFNGAPSMGAPFGHMLVEKQ